jgi:uncharacterized repeat protein (TIGR03806 family)
VRRATSGFALPLFTLASLALATATFAQAPLTRTPAASLRFPATAPASTYSTTRAFPTLSFTQPVALVTPPGENRRLFVVEKTGRIWVIPDVTATVPTRTLFLDLSSIVATGDGTDERGLLALAFHPNYAANGRFFVWYTLNATTSAGGGLHDRLAEFHVSATNASAADASSEQPLITQRDEAANHNGGQLLFGPDDYLYLSIGDEGGANDQFQNSQRIDRDFFSGIFRLDVDRRPGSLPSNAHASVHTATYSIPPDNPFVGATAFNGASVNPAAVRTELWAVGLRNPWRMSFDPATGRLWCGDVGQGTREEIDVIVRGGNYGWNYREGTVAGPRGNPPAGTSFIAPIWDYPNPAQGSSVTGGIVYRGTRFPDLVGKYLFADFVSGRIWSLTPDGENPVASDRVQLLATDGGISSFGLDPSNGDILLADLTENAIKRLVATTIGGTQLPATLSATGAFTNVVTFAPAPGVVAYEPNVSFWSDRATKHRWFALPATTGAFGFSPDDAWSLPTGAIWIKHFDLELTRGNPATARRVETRVLVKTPEGVYGASYRWNETQTDATLVPDEGTEQQFTVIENGSSRVQTWHFPSRAECQTCHTSAGGFALTFNTRQLNRDFTFPGGTANIITALAQAGYLTGAPASTAGLPALAASDDESQPLELRARSYLDVNCSQCHQPGGTALGHFDARAAIPLPLTNLVNGPLIDNGGDSANRVLAPGDAAHSRILQRMSVRGSRPTATAPSQMPPIATNERDTASESLLSRWIASLANPGPAQPASRLINLAARASAGTGNNTLITGFVIGPGAEKRVLIRAVGPALAAAPFNVAGTLADPVLTVLGPDSSTRVAATNDNWAAGDATTFTAVGAFALPAGSRDAAVLAQLSPGAYTAQVTSPNNGTGLALVEIYDADAPASSSSGARLINLAVRTQVGTGANVLIPGIVVSGGANKTVLVRAVGPRLATAPFNLTGTLAEPVLTLFYGTLRVARNAGWSSAANAVAIRETASAVGAFPLPESSRDSALLVTLSPGAYTLQLSGANNTSGVALVEVYEVP